MRKNLLLWDPFIIHYVISRFEKDYILIATQLVTEPELL